MGEQRERKEEPKPNSEGKTPPVPNRGKNRARTGVEEEKVTRKGDLQILSPTKPSTEAEFEYETESLGLKR